MPYISSKQGNKYVVYKKKADGSRGERVGATKGDRESLKRYLAALHINESEDQINNMELGDIVEDLLSAQQQLKKMHWTAETYAAHEALGKAYDDLDELIDDFTEVLMGKYGRVEFDAETDTTFELDQLQQHEFLSEFTEFLLDLDNELDADTDTDALNIRDEMLATVNKLRYLLTFQ
jgi:DNA-binding ferritin-like protein